MQTKFAAGVSVYCDVCDPEGVKIQDCLVSAGLSACLGSFSAPSWIRREQALGNAFLKCIVAGFAAGSQQLGASFRSVFRCCA